MNNSFLQKISKIKDNTIQMIKNREISIDQEYESVLLCWEYVLWKLINIF